MLSETKQQLADTISEKITRVQGHLEHFEDYVNL